MRALADNAARNALFEPILIFGLFSLFSDLNGELNFEAELWNLLWGREMQGLIHNARIAWPLLSSDCQNLPSSLGITLPPSPSPPFWFWEINKGQCQGQGHLLEVLPGTWYLQDFLLPLIRVPQFFEQDLLQEISGISSFWYDGLCFLKYLEGRILFKERYFEYLDFFADYIWLRDEEPSWGRIVGGITSE